MHCVLQLNFTTSQAKPAKQFSMSEVSNQRLAHLGAMILCSRVVVVFWKFICKVRFQIHNELLGKGNYREQTCTVRDAVLGPRGNFGPIPLILEENLCPALGSIKNLIMVIVMIMMNLSRNHVYRHHTVIVVNLVYSDRQQ